MSRYDIQERHSVPADEGRAIAAGAGFQSGMDQVGLVFVFTGAARCRCHSRMKSLVLGPPRNAVVE